jgi:hypothetical protein
MKAIYGQEVAPGFADWYLGRTGYSSQQTAQPVSPNRPDNLFAPVPADYAANGIFTGVAKSFSGQNWLNLHRAPVSLITVGALGLAAVLWKMNR